MELQHKLTMISTLALGRIAMNMKQLKVFPHDCDDSKEIKGMLNAITSESVLYDEAVTADILTLQLRRGVNRG